MIEQQHREGRAVGDHYAKPGANDRVWNAIEKLAIEAPDVFVDYYANDMVALGRLAWLGPGYQISSQINVVNPGGEAQQPHRDYHLGFMTDDEAEAYPAHAHRLSPMLTLQGAVAHCDMPVETGPTMYLPFSQQYELGYLAWRNPDFIAYFDEHRTQLPLSKGDIVFFNPALFHAAGSNVTDRRAAHGEPAADLVRDGAGDGDDGPSADVGRRLPGAARPRRGGLPTTRRQRGHGRRRRLRVPDEPRQRPAARRAHPAVARRHHVRGTSRRAHPPPSSPNGSRRSPPADDPTEAERCDGCHRCETWSVRACRLPFGAPETAPGSRLPYVRHRPSVKPILPVNDMDAAIGSIETSGSR